jgi:hypothetical protein
MRWSPGFSWPVASPDGWTDSGIRLCGPVHKKPGSTVVLPLYFGVFREIEKSEKSVISLFERVI